MRIILIFPLFLLALAAETKAADPSVPSWLLTLSRGICAADTIDGYAAAAGSAGIDIASQDVIRANGPVRAIRLQAIDGRTVDVQQRILNGTPAGGRIVVSGKNAGRKTLFMQTGPDCEPLLVRIVAFDADGRADELFSFNGANLEALPPEKLNPPVPTGKDPGGVAVAVVDAGINYTLPGFTGRLARDKSGKSLGYDFHDNDDRPFDLDPSRPVYFPIRHGTAVASIILREAPDARLIPIRFPARQPGRFSDVVDHVARGPARIVAMPLGGSREADWTALGRAIESRPEILFIVSAGNDGRDIDVRPIFPAAFTSDNVLTVTSSGSHGRLPPDSNWGATSVDIAVPGERINVIDHRGARARASGTSYAVPRVAALAARIASRQPDWSAKQIKEEILGLAVPLTDPDRQVRHGWIINPAIE